MLQQGVETVLVKRGTQGSLLLGRGGLCISQPIFPVEKARRLPTRKGACIVRWHLL